MQKFFALIRSTRDARERVMSGADKLQEEEKKKGKPADAWNPSFQPEDFMEGGGDQSKGPPPPQASLALTLAIAGHFIIRLGCADARKSYTLDNCITCYGANNNSVNGSWRLESNFEKKTAG
ncbi:hypothetical protein LOK49_LG02G02379 [Camellia lanceoleosa]|uniref:Uncharacterized protein n=1 Tax=Camellia lanceoleosa TaxID=1840588 RepID=A0ACC0IVI5_9ERIC|nr:hypothetical protein LOK49_LG02G02379 [Camellia lanceoleosa]